MLELAGIKDVPALTKNPQANAICERMHQTVENILRASQRTRPPAAMPSAEQLADEALAMAQHVLRCAHSRALNASPGSDKI